MKYLFILLLIPYSLFAQGRQDEFKGRYEVWNHHRVYLNSTATTEDGVTVVVQRSETDNWTFNQKDTLLSEIMDVTPSMGIQFGSSSIASAADSINFLIEILGATALKNEALGAPADSQFVLIGFIDLNNGFARYRSIILDSTPNEIITVADWHNPITVETPVCTHWRVRVIGLSTASETPDAFNVKLRRAQYIPN